MPGVISDLRGRVFGRLTVPTTAECLDTTPNFAAGPTQRLLNTVESITAISLSAHC